MNTLLNSLCATTAVVFATASSGHAQSIVEIPTPTVPMSTIDMDLVGPVGPTTLAELNAAATPPGGHLLAITLSPTANNDPYNNFTNGRALASVAGVMSLIDPPTAVFQSFSTRLDLPPSTQFGIGIGDWSGPISMTFYSGGTTVATFVSSTYVAAETKYYELLPGGSVTSFNRVDIANNGYVITELAVQVDPQYVIADFSDTAQGCGGTTIGFFDRSIGTPTLRGWDVDNDGIVDYSTPDPVHTYPAPGVYQCRLTIASATTASTITLPIRVGLGGKLTTTFASNNGGSPGGALYFDIEVKQPILVTGYETNYPVAAGTPVGLNVHLIAGSHIGNESNAAAWTLVASDDGSAVAAGLDQPTEITLQTPLTLQPGRYGMALVAVGAAHRYTSGALTNQGHRNGYVSLTKGAASNVPLTAPTIATRSWNGSLLYEPTAGAEDYGTGTPSGAPNAPAPTLTTLAPPRIGQTGTLALTQYDQNAIGFLTAGEGRGPLQLPFGTYHLGSPFLVLTIAIPMPVGLSVFFNIPVPNNCSLRGARLNFLHSNLVLGLTESFTLSNGTEWFLDD